MSTVKSLLSALLAASALFAFACGDRDEREAEEVSRLEPPAVESPRVESTAPPQDPELRPEPRSVDIEEEPPSPAPEEDLSELEKRERELRAREAELAARERVLREAERREQEQPRPAPNREREQPRPAPEPEPRIEESARAEPVPEPAPEAEPEPEEAEPEPAVEPAEPQEEEEEEPQPRAVEVTVPVGTAFEVEFLGSVASNTSRAGDTFRVRVARDIVVDGEVAIPGGSEVVGRVTEATPLRKVGGRARLGLEFTDVVLPSGSTIPIDASFVEQGRSETGRDAATIGGGAASGAVLGRILSRKDRSRGAVIGAIIGAAAGAVIASRTPGEEIEISQGTVVTLALDEEVEIRQRR
ncbi:MAG TPA: glycine zipper domain-containing protein [Thermoanaerobaculia bacterium]|nr:glycine zipper domain-containing protein [Thermoanaerobaculia bacterium]